MSVIRCSTQVYRFVLTKFTNRDLSRISFGAMNQIGRSSGFAQVHSIEFNHKPNLVKRYSKMASQNVVSTEQLLKESNKNGSLIIDVREIEEINETGVIPGGINVPLGSLEKALQSSPAEFKSAFGIEKPDKDTKIILSCRSGKRSSMAYEKLQALGYTNLWNYSGGWLGYEKYRNENTA